MTSATQERKGQGLSVSTLVMIALGILVLILAIVFYDDITDRSRDTIGSCQNLQGQCFDTCPSGTLHNALGDKSCSEGQICCSSRGQNT